MGSRVNALKTEISKSNINDLPRNMASFNKLTPN